jgi:hypothetical protein
MANEVFGSDDQRALLRLGRAMADLTRGDMRYGYYGCTATLSTPNDGHLAALCRVQGYSSYSTVPIGDVSAVKVGLSARSLTPIHYAK